MFTQFRTPALPYLTEQEMFFIEHFRDHQIITHRALHIFWHAHGWGVHSDDVTTLQQLLDHLEAKGLIVLGDSAASFPKDSSLQESIIFRDRFMPEA